MKKFFSKNIGIISLVAILIILIFGIGIAGYKVKQQNEEKALETFVQIEENTNKNLQNIEESPEVNENVTPEEEAEYEEYLDKEEKKEEKKVEESNLPYYIKVNYKAQTVTVYGKDANGEYTNPVTVFVCSTGTDTPKSGVYPLKAKYRWINLKGDVYGQYSSRIVGSILFHSVYYYEKFNPGSLAYTSYDKLGVKASAGCVRLNVAAAKWIYDNCPVGTKVEFYASSNPGPLGKPISQKISSNETCRGWDPTDPDPSNPWHTYIEPTPDVIPQPEPIPETEPTPTPEPELNISIKEVELSNNKLELFEGESKTVKVTMNPSDADIEKIEWKSNDPQIATVSSDGEVKAIGKGNTTITVTVTDKDGNTISKECEVTVEEKEIVNELVNNIVNSISEV